MFLKFWFARKVCLERKKNQRLEGHPLVSTAEHSKRKESKNFWKDGSF